MTDPLMRRGALENIRDTHSNVRIQRIEHSGWPSKPRNVGLELSQGEYVLFMDHDDELYPRALEADMRSRPEPTLTCSTARRPAPVTPNGRSRSTQPIWTMPSTVKTSIP